ncbi:MAG: DUF2007 domain-containing protein [Deltaproteobacteria bacterium]|nr:DUF2007 domain-containing protein [Deltaproteobacteria bacterium]
MTSGWVVLCVCRDVAEAGFVVSVVGAADIPAVLGDAGLGAWAPGLGGGGCSVRVPAAHLERARQLVDEARSARTEDASATTDDGDIATSSAAAFARPLTPRFASPAGWVLIAVLAALDLLQFAWVRRCAQENTQPQTGVHAPATAP